MARYIDADALISAIKRELWDWVTVDGMTATTVLKQTITDIQNAPTADVVEVVRCKDCVHHKNAPRTMYVWCECVDGLLPNDWFCADGERRDDEESTKRTD